jgi:peptidoglycan/xylan/chitin deacetylase (PgdA/CDA1 family)
MKRQPKKNTSRGYHVFNFISAHRLQFATILAVFVILTTAFSVYAASIHYQPFRTLTLASASNQIFLAQIFRQNAQTQPQEQTPTPTSTATASHLPTATVPSGPVTLLRYTFNRSNLPALTYQAVTLKIYIGTPSAFYVLGDGLEIPYTYNRSTGFVTVSTAASMLELRVYNPPASSQLGAYSITPLKDDKQWAWSHSFDDNVNFEARGIPAFEKYGWRGTVYLIGYEIDNTRQEDWIIDKPDIISLAKKGWGIGNHSWSHQNVQDIGGTNAAKQDVVRLNTYFRQALDAAGLSSYRLISFAAPNFDSDYHAIILNLRNTHTTDLLFNESGSDAILQVDANASGGNYPTFDLDQPIGRDWRIEEYGANSTEDRAFRQDLNNMLAQLDSQHHFWLNTFNHSVDDQPSNQSIFAFLPWVYNNYGPCGVNNVWVAPSEEIYSYLLVRSKITVQFQLTQK